MKFRRIRITRRSSFALLIVGLALTCAAFFTQTTSGRTLLVNRGVQWLPRDRVRHSIGRFVLVKMRRESAPVLLKLLKDQDPYRQEQAAEILEQMGDKVLTELVGSIPDEDPKRRYWCAVIMANLRSQAKIVVPVLIGALADQEAAVRAAAAESLGRLGPAASEATVRLCEVLVTDDDGEVRMNAARSLGQIGTEAKAALPYVAQAMRDDNAEVRRVAYESFESLNGY